MKKETVKKQKRCIITKEEFHDKIISLIDAVGTRRLSYSELVDLAKEKHLPYVLATLAALKGVAFFPTGTGRKIFVPLGNDVKSRITYFFTHSLLLTLRKQANPKKKKEVPVQKEFNVVATESLLVKLKDKIDLKFYTDEQLIAELKKRGYKVMKSKCTWEEC